jgi:hypothetical protein
LWGAALSPCDDSVIPAACGGRAIYQQGCRGPRRLKPMVYRRSSWPAIRRATKKTGKKLPGYLRPHRRIQRVSNARAPVFRQAYVHPEPANKCSIRHRNECRLTKDPSLSASGSQPRREPRQGPVEGSWSGHWLPLPSTFASKSHTASVVQMKRELEQGNISIDSKARYGEREHAIIVLSCGSEAPFQHMEWVHVAHQRPADAFSGSTLPLTVSKQDRILDVPAQHVQLP